LPAGSEAAGQLIRDARAATSEALADVRRLVYGLRPPALDNLGLVGAIEHHTGQLATDGCRVRLDATTLPALPAAIEVAAYRTVLEAVTNSIRHGHARNCAIRLHAESGVLEIAVDDDGVSAGPWMPGVGLLSMQELAAELDGVVEAGPIDGGGSRVSARYPIGATET
jgi:signal transduction histidine kinase